MKKYKYTELLLEQTNKTKKTQSTKTSQVKASKGRQYKAWDKVAKSKRYTKAVEDDLCQGVTSGVIDECFDGICLNLSDENSVRSSAVQKRILRRIVEKRQAQAAHRRVGRTDSLISSHIEKTCCSNSIQAIKQYCFCA